jgi:hypothetical protein
MYAHQVIEAISNSNPGSEIGKNKKAKSSFIQLLQESQKFYFGDIKNILSVFNGLYKDTPLFSYGLAEGIMLPYQICTLMFENTLGKDNMANKVTIIATSDDKGDEISIFLWLFLKDEKDWAIFPVAVHVEGLLDLTQTSQMVLQPLYGYEMEQDFSNSLVFSPMKTAMKLVNYFLMLLNCKNITTIDNPPPEKLNKKRSKSGKCPLFTYKTLVIKPTGKKQASQDAQGLWENRVHLCRGHFKTYTEENPLFGKFTGRYWWQPSVRGNKKKGVVMKDYRVEMA